MKSVIGSFYTMSKCLDQVPNMTFEDWQAHNEQQEKYLAIYKNCMGAAIPEIEARISKGDVAPINKFLKQRGFDLELSPISKDDLAIASVLEVLLKWISKGKKASVFYQTNQYKGVNLSAGVQVRNIGGFSRPTAIIQCQNGDHVYMTIPDEEPEDAFECLDLARKLVSQGTTPAANYENRVIFPMTDLDVKPDISWILGLSDREQVKWVISQAMMQTKVKMDLEGVLIKEAVAMVARCMSCNFDDKHPLVIDEPFLFVVKREGLKEPLFSALLGTDGWLKE